MSNYSPDVSVLQRRVVQLETTLALCRDALHQSTSIANRPNHGSGQDDENRSRSDGIEQSLEDIHLGVSLGSTRHGADLFPDKWLAESSDKWSLLPPTSASSWSIVEFSLGMTSWLHCAIRFDVFRREHEEFWSAIGHGDHSALRQHRWMAIYLAILAASS